MQQVAAQVITPRFRELRSDQVFQKRPGDYVTVADREAEALLTHALHKAYPQAFILGEEATFTDPELVKGLASAGHAFTIDPVDGTGNFVKGSPDHAVMIAELHAGELTRSWIWQPEHQRAYVAERGAGVTLNGQRLSAPEPSDPPVGATSRRNWGRFELPGKLAKIVGSFNCAGMDYPKLIAGGIDYFAYFMPKPWDHLPGQLMLQEVGGDVLKLDGTPYGAGGGTDPIFSGPNRQRLAEVVGLWRANWTNIDVL